MDQNNQPTTVSALLVTRKIDGEVHILNVLAHNKQHYGFPGGKLEPGETPEQAIMRETHEELGAAPADVQYVDTFTAKTPEGRDITMHVFTGSVPEKISPNSEIKELHWLTYKQMCEQKEMLTPMTIEYALPIVEKFE